MKRFFYIMLLLAVASYASAAGRVNLSRIANKKDNPAVTAGRDKADAIYESVSRQYAQGKISADSVINLALYHKVWSRDVAARCLKLVADDRNPRAETELGVIYVFTPGDTSHADEGLKLLQAAAQAGYNQANGYLGYYYFQNKDYARAKSYFDALHPMTQGIEYAALGSVYLQGDGVT